MLSTNRIGKIYLYNLLPGMTRNLWRIEWSLAKKKKWLLAKSTSTKILLWSGKIMNACGMCGSRSAVVNGVDHILTSTSEWPGFESRWFYQSEFEFGKTPL